MRSGSWPASNGASADPLATECLGRVLAPFRWDGDRLQSGPGAQAPTRTSRIRFGMQAGRGFLTAAVVRGGSGETLHSLFALTAAR